MTADLERRDKNRITLMSIAAASVMTCLKLVVGLLTGSLGLISEAAHSGLDLVASIITFFSVRIAGRPADDEHPYGHGRFENLSATIQGLLLVVTAAAIIYESVRRIFFAPAHVEASAWTFAVMLGSILVDLWRSRMLSRAAQRYHSRALEADALNFRADMFSSAVVILGLAIAAYGDRVARSGLLERADAVAALVVALVIVGMSGRLALGAVDILLDRAPARLRKRMTDAASTVPGVVASQPIRLRESGSRLFADIVVSVPRTTSLAEAHTITEQIEKSIRAVEPRTETVVHVEPAISETETAAERIRAVALRMGTRTHHEQVHRVDDLLEASLHVEVEPNLALGEAYRQSQELVRELKADNPLLRTVDTHLEVAMPDPSRRREITSEHPDVVEDLRGCVDAAGLDAVCHEVRLYRSEGPGWDVTLHCDFPPDLAMGQVHSRTETLEQVVRERFDRFEHVVIQAEPGPG